MTKKEFEEYLKSQSYTNSTTIKIYNILFKLFCLNRYLLTLNQ